MNGLSNVLHQIFKLSQTSFALFLISLATSEKSLNIEPPTASFPAGGGTATYRLINTSKTRLAFKVCENVQCGTLPRAAVYGFIEVEQEMPVDIHRLPGPPREDKFVVQWAEVPQEETDAQAPFKAGAEAGEVILLAKCE
ncbi:MSP (Major sperm protein) domain-containing protein [Ditylenchus destructor]|uniref:Major sperm protein n=1 Tax=Ditylenchus destructor TaxID=166010 RepID=A0AAD4N7K7_9BILA|nr:MSP (Major sperm protein) domain-containing protein [Ditylenchus destructor]